MTRSSVFVFDVSFYLNMVFQPKAFEKAQELFGNQKLLQQIFHCNESKITEFEMIDAKNPSTAYVVMYKLMTRTRR